jgi:hypothetical protein
MPEDDDNIKQVDSYPSRYKNYLNQYKSIEWNVFIKTIYHFCCNDNFGYV